MFTTEIALIENEDVRGIVTRVLDEVDPKFFVISSSSTNAHHNPQQHGENGLEMTPGSLGVY